MRLSVCITHYNRPERLAATLSSLAEQTRPPDEVLLWDDCSPRDPSNVAASFIKKFRSFRYHRNKKNLGMPGNLNAVVCEASGDLIANLHDADRFDPRLLESWESALVSHPSAGFVFCGTRNEPQSPGERPREFVHSFAPLTSGREFFLQHYVGSLSSPVWGTVMARQDAYAKLGEFDPRWGPWADVDMWMRMCGRFDVAYVKQPLLLLDMEVTDWRKFRWRQKLLHDAMVCLNVRRLLGDDPEQMQRCLVRQRKYLCKRVFRLLIGRAVHRDWRQFSEGIQLGRIVLTASPFDEVLSRFDLLAGPSH